MSRVLFMWCEVCKAWRVVHRRGAYHSHCPRCDWDMRAHVVSQLEVYKHWRNLP